MRSLAIAAAMLGIVAVIALVTSRRGERSAPVVVATASPPRAVHAAPTAAVPIAPAATAPPRANRSVPEHASPAAIGGVAILAAAARAQAVVSGLVSAPEQIDAHGWRAELRIDRVLLGSLALGETVTIGWEELSVARQVRFGGDERVLVVLDPLPTQSLWRKRFPIHDRTHPVLVVASAGDAFLTRPDGVTLDVLEHYLAMAPEARNGAPGAERLAELVRDGHPTLAAEALKMLETNPTLADLLGQDGAESLLAAARSPERAHDLRARALRLAARHRLPGTRDTALALAAPGSLIRADAYRALAELPDGLTSADVSQLLGDADPEVRVAAIESARADLARERLVRLARDDAAPAVRLAAGQALVTRRGAGDRGPFADMIVLLDDPDGTVRSGMAESIGALGADAVGPLAAVVDDGSERAALAAVLGLARTGPQGAVLLRSIAKSHEREPVRALARLALGEMASPPE